MKLIPTYYHKAEARVKTRLLYRGKVYIVEPILKEYWINIGSALSQISKGNWKRHETI